MKLDSDIKDLVLAGKEVLLNLPSIKGYVDRVLFGVIYLEDSRSITFEDLFKQYGDGLKIVNSGSHYIVIQKS